ncbi:MAG: DUF3784 domain-containing protein [Clostridia bacterium]|nr:DUF3784 domain-containing protein [Clostridia bacterium]
MIGSIIIGIVGVMFVVIGWVIWKKEKITLLHDYHYDKVSEDDKKPFCTLSGVGVLLMGIGMLVTAIIMGITESLWSFIAFAAGFAAGIIMLIYAGRRYNR